MSHLVHCLFSLQKIFTNSHFVYCTAFSQTRGRVKAKTFQSKSLSTMHGVLLIELYKLNFHKVNISVQRMILLRKTVNSDTKKNQYYNHLIFCHLSMLDFKGRNHIKKCCSSAVCFCPWMYSSPYASMFCPFINPLTEPSQLFSQREHTCLFLDIQLRPSNDLRP